VARAIQLQVFAASLGTTVGAFLGTVQRNAHFDKPAK
jgi:hypothetical protein